MKYSKVIPLEVHGFANDQLKHVTAAASTKILYSVEDPVEQVNTVTSYKNKRYDQCLFFFLATELLGRV